MSWINSTLGEVCDIINGKNQKMVLSENGNYPIYGSGGNVMGYANDYLCEKDTVIIGRKGNISKPILISERFWNVDTAFGIYPKTKKMLPKFNYYQCLKIDFASYNKGTTIPSLVKSDLLTIPVKYPESIVEQETIVVKLDQAFVAIDQAKANIEKNIANAKELFQSKLNQIFSQNGDGWVEKTLEKTFKLKSGDGLTSKMMIQDGEYPVYGGNNIAGYYDKFNFEHGVIVGRVGALCGNARFINEKVWITDNAFKLTEFKYEFDFKFLSYLLNFKNLRSYARQAAQPVISNSSLKDVILNFPNSIETQQQIVNQLDQLQEQTNLLVTKYKQKLANLEELKKSILEKAFKGELGTKEIEKV